MIFICFFLLLRLLIHWLVFLIGSCVVLFLCNVYFWFVFALRLFWPSIHLGMRTDFYGLPIKSTSCEISKDWIL